MAFKEVYPAKFGSLWNCNYFSKRSFAAIPGKKVIWTPVAALPPATILAGGVSHIAFNDGQTGDNIPNGNRAVFQGNPEFIKTYCQTTLGGKLIGNCTEQECKDIVNTVYNARGGNLSVVTTGSSEFNAGNYQWTQTFIPKSTETGVAIPAVPQQYEWIDREWARLCALNGGHFYGDYDGHGGAAQATGDGFARNGSENLRQAYLTDSVAYDVMHAHTPFGNPFFTNDHFLFRDGLVKTYWDGSTQPDRRVIDIATNMLLSRRALNFKGSTRELLSFPFPGKQEFINRQEHYKRTVPAGGSIDAVGFPQYSHRVQAVIGYLSLVLTNAIYMWEDTTMFGTDPNIIQSSNFEFTYTGSGATRVASKNKYVAGDQFTFPNMFYNGHNAMLTGVEMYSRLSAWASQNISYAPYRPTGSGSYAATGKDYLLNAYQQSEPFGFLHAEGNYRGLFAVDMNRRAGTYREREFNCTGGTVVINMEGQRPYFIMGQV